MASRLRAGEKALIAAVGVLVVVFLVMLLDRLAPAAPTAPTAEPTSTGTATTTPTDVVDLADVAWTFRLPSGNIGCAVTEDGALCAIRVFEYEPPSLAGCEGDTGVAFRLDAEGARPLCTTGTAEFPDARELPYGESEGAGEFTCTSSETGVACRDALGDELTLRRASFGL